MKQHELPLKRNVAENEVRPMTLSAVIGALDRAKRSLAPTMKSTPNQAMSIASVDKAITALRPISEIFSDLEQHRIDLDRAHQIKLVNRREVLLKTARDAHWNVRRTGDSYDFVGCFQVSYNNDRVKLLIGSEELSSFDEADGNELFVRLKDEREKLDESPFVRSDFFRSIKGAIDLARSQKLDQDGKVPIRTLYPLVVLTRHSLDSVFIKRPMQKFFTEYSMVQFAYDLARFGKDSWKEDGYRLRTRTPNMNDNISGKTVTLPSLDRDGSGGQQITVIWIERA